MSVWHQVRSSFCWGSTNITGVAADVGHINTASTVKGYDQTPSELRDCLTGAEIVVIPAGVPRKPGMTRDGEFFFDSDDCSRYRSVQHQCLHCPRSRQGLRRSLPRSQYSHHLQPSTFNRARDKLIKQVNSTVPIAAEVFKAHGVYNPKRLFGVTTLDVVRASRFISQIKNTDPAGEKVTVVGGHSGVTIVPLLSQSGVNLDGQKLDDYVHRVQFGGDEVVTAKAGAGSATLSMAMAGARFTESLLKAAQGQKGVVEPTFVDSPLFKDQGCDFFASNVELGPSGVEKIHPIGKVTDFEQKLVDACVVDLAKNIKKGVEWVKANPGN
jgi:malate dehydrogenase